MMIITFGKFQPTWYHMSSNYLFDLWVPTGCVFCIFYCVICNHCSDLYRQHFPQNCHDINTLKFHWLQVNIGLGNNYLDQCWPNSHSENNPTNFISTSFAAQRIELGWSWSSRNITSRTILFNEENSMTSSVPRRQMSCFPTQIKNKIDVKCCSQTEFWYLKQNFAFSMFYAQSVGCVNWLNVCYFSLRPTSQSHHP